MDRPTEAGCIFCKIVRGDVPATFAYQDDDVVAIEDLNPQAPHHLLVLPRKHYSDLNEMIDRGDGRLAGSLLSAGAVLGRRRGGTGGFRLVVNTGSDGGQTVGHVHLHVLAGRSMGWPPG